MFTPLTWELDDVIIAGLKSTQPAFATLCDGLSIRVLKWTTFGKNTIKKFRVSPDAFVQQAIQLAGQQYFGHPVLTYESGSTRRFQYGMCSAVAAAIGERERERERERDRQTDRDR